MDNAINTVDHDEIQEWIENRNGQPAKLLERSLESDTIRLEFENIRQKEQMEQISWDEFFQLFEEEDMVFQYKQNSDGPPEQNYDFTTHQRGAMQEDISTEMDSEPVQDNVLETDETESSTGDKTSAEKSDNIRDD